MNHAGDTSGLLKDAEALKAYIKRTLYGDMEFVDQLEDELEKGARAAGVLLPLGFWKGTYGDICFILNKRSRRVRQAGDLCCPGGSVEGIRDRFISWLLITLGRPYSVRDFWKLVKGSRADSSSRILTLLGAALRESWEEMRLSPFGIELLGGLSPQRLRRSDRVIQPFLVWVRKQDQFVPNWEVEKIVKIPLRELLCEENYARFRIYMDYRFQREPGQYVEDVPCFLHQDGTEVDVLWGATLRIISRFLERFFNFQIPDMSNRPIVPAVLDKSYWLGMNG